VTRTGRSQGQVMNCYRLNAMSKRLCSTVSLCILLSSFLPLMAQERKLSEGELRLSFNNMPLDMLLDDYSEKTGRTILRDPKLPKANVTLRGQGELTIDEYLQAIETVLGMNGVALLRVGEKFLKVVPIGQARQNAMDIRIYTDDIDLDDTDELVSQMIQLQHIEIAEASKAIEALKHAYGQVHPFERTNSILVTDTASNISRIIQVLEFIDRPVEIREEPHVIVIRFAKASEIKRKLEEIVAESQKKAEKSTVPRAKPSGAPGVVAPAAPPGVIRAATSRTVEKTAVTLNDIIEAAERGIIRGEVKIVADDRTNILIIITRPENMGFFEKIVKVLDVETEPDVIVKILQLEYADAENVASTLNTLIGKSAEKGQAGAVAVGEKVEGEGSSAALREYVEKIGDVKAEKQEKSKVGELSATNIKILPDKRTNSLLIMARKADLMTLEEIIVNMDMMLPQVLIEAVIIQVALDDNVSSGVHWVQRAVLAYRELAGGGMDPIGAFAGAAGSGAGDLMPVLEDASTLTTLDSWASGAGLTSYFTHFGLDLHAIVKMVKTDSRTHILSAPVIVTTDNTKATITSSEQKYFLKGSTVDTGGVVRPEVEIKDIGLELEVTPHINKSRNVMMEISQSVSDPGSDQAIEGQGSWPTTKKRSFTASIAVHDRETIVLGGLVRNYTQKERTGVPLLSSIPLLGRFFSFSRDTDTRGEVVVFVTPYVLDTPEEIEGESTRRKDALSVSGLWKRGWSASNLSDLSRADRAAERRRKKREEKEKIRATIAARTPEPVAEQPPESEPELVDDPEIEKIEQELQDLEEPKQDPMSNLDPELIRFIERQERRWGRSLRKVDESVEQEMRESEAAP
jgi:general secretion pathway protein D